MEEPFGQPSIKLISVRNTNGIKFFQVEKKSLNFKTPTTQNKQRHNNEVNNTDTVLNLNVQNAIFKFKNSHHDFDITVARQV